MFKPVFRSVPKSITQRYGPPRPGLLRINLPALGLAALGWLAGTVAPALSHEFWIEPEKYQVNSGATLKAGLRNGQMYKGARLPYFDHRIQRFETVHQGQVTPYRGRMGDMPALVLEDLPPGLLIALHETTPDLVTYDSWQEFAEFAAHQGLGDPGPMHRQRGLPAFGFGESYSRHTKMLVAVGHGEGADRAFGLETEFVALQNPYTEAGLQAQTNSTAPATASGSDSALVPLSLLLLYRGVPRVAAQVEIFARAPDGAVSRSLAQTDDAGLVHLRLHRQHSYLANAVVLRPLEGDPKAVWQTLWASITFALPE
ncbi:DUF4198 domain-containing protein [Pseudophaeobacter flagellatus]|uniref:DUF4198 domain-containing protein n=1 Tax=Pseudophaeobacter flagellatus TaxID=2899119 RepID=UPI001E2E2B06|nr:DUF4198 domain-containing protein [Pseudophaeobacter flagellatus]MCD9150040.1 DUF4198 domain-containing protein [Pseudophaeobacter flagellatus]